MLVGRHVALRRPTGQHDGTLQLFRRTNEIRAIRNQPNFAITINPPLPHPTRRGHPFSHHPFQQHAKPHDPPVRSRILWQFGAGWATADANDGNVYASTSSLLKLLLLVHRRVVVSGTSGSGTVMVDRSVRGGHLDRMLTRSPHTPLDACSHVLTFEAVGGACGQSHVLTSSADPFTAWVSPGVLPGENQNVRVTIYTTEAAAAGVAHHAPFAQRFPLTAAKVRLVLGLIAPIILDGQAP
ncbi:unnamed protein product [Vitrella brassicaformis CCMP3155]|uniref:Uncharacterized protein n=1 Tax=Vitrella brassicaformis (strain CCMP3155) TaxID=1169540 RepID=A0A0G4GBL9_VITBC|nr:unnamed protein product [Vitrella brassicaformis CCMP3155]|eukprot:CEM26522.1 unnamed protein product [Vitrella brassicaformis CCMP3155]